LVNVLVPNKITWLILDGVGSVLTILEFWCPLCDEADGRGNAAKIHRYDNRDEVELLSRPGPGGYCFARLHGIADTLEVRDIHLDDLRAQGGTAEIEAVLETLPAWVEIARQRAKRRATIYRLS
jgi:hypothetical protein